MKGMNDVAPLRSIEVAVEAKNESFSDENVSCSEKETGA